MHSITRRAALMATGFGLAMPAIAQQRPLTLVVPFPPGGSTDIMARLLAERIQPLLGQPVVVENRGGGATVVGAEYVARSAPDGHTVLVNSGTTLTINPYVLRNLSYKVEDFAPVALLSVLPFAFLAQNRLPGTVREFIAHAQANPGRINYGTNGPSSFNNITALLIADLFGIRMQDVTYRGDAQQLADFLAGTLDLLVVGGASANAPHRDGKGRIIAWTGERRMPYLPEIPTFAEFNPRAVSQTYFGLVAPARTPAAAIERLATAAAAALREATLRERLMAEGQFAAGEGPEAFATFLRREAERWKPILAKLDLQGG
jgi:tripartite-type tricarboxylate transporter receptor subunit TctC